MKGAFCKIPQGVCCRREGQALSSTEWGGQTRWMLSSAGRPHGKEPPCPCVPSGVLAAITHHCIWNLGLFTKSCPMMMALAIFESPLYHICINLHFYAIFVGILTKGEAFYDFIMSSGVIIHWVYIYFRNISHILLWRNYMHFFKSIYRLTELQENIGGEQWELPWLPFIKKKPGVPSLTLSSFSKALIIQMTVSVFYLCMYLLSTCLCQWNVSHQRAKPFIPSVPRPGPSTQHTVNTWLLSKWRDLQFYWKCYFKT